MNNDSPFTFFLVLGVFVFTFGWRIYSWFQEKKFMRNVATSLGFTYESSLPVTGLPGNIFGNGGELINIISGIRNGLTTRIYNYRFRVGKTVTYFTLYEAILPYDLPHLILICKNNTNWLWNGYFGAQGMIPVHFEGDFNKSFDVYTEKDLDLDAFEIFTPDVMTAFIDNAKYFSLETNQRTFYLIGDGLISNTKDFNQLTGTADFALTTLLPKFKETTSDVVAMESLKANLPTPAN